MSSKNVQSVNVKGVVITKRKSGESGGKYVLHIPANMDGKGLMEWKQSNSDAIADAKSLLSADEQSDEGDSLGRE